MQATVTGTNIREWEKRIHSREEAFAVIQQGETLLAQEEMQDNYDLNVVMGKAYAHINDFKKSVFFFTKALQCEASPEVYFLLAKEYFKIESYKQSILFIQKALKAAPDHLEMIAFLAKVQIGMEQIEDAEKILKKLEQMESDASQSAIIDEVRQLLVQYYLHHESFKKVIQIANVSIQKGLANHNHYEAMGLSMLKLGKNREALQYLETSREMHPHRDKYHFPTYEEKKSAMGEIPVKIREMEQEISRSQQAKSSSNHHFDLGFLYYYDGQHDRALELFQKALDLRLRAS